MYQQDAIKTFEAMVVAIGEKATQEQINRVVDWMRDNVAEDYIGICADIALEYCGNLFTDISEYAGECGRYV